MKAKNAFILKLWPLSRIASRMFVPFRCGLEGRARGVVLTGGLADRGAHNELEYLVCAEARSLCGGDVRVGNLVGVLGNLVDQRRYGPGEPCVIDRGTALYGRRRAVAFEYPRDQHFAGLRDVSHIFP